MATELLSEIILSEDERAVIDTIRIWLLCDDILRTNSDTIRSTKQQWLDQWMRMFTPSRPPCRRLEDINQYEVIAKLREVPSKLKGGSILVELLTFTPYIRLESDPRSEENTKERASALKKCALGDESRTWVLGRVAEPLGFECSYPDKLLKCFKDAVFALQGGWTRTIAYTMGGGLVLALGGAAAATGIGASIGAAMGLKGAAAVAAGLALLGGGSVATGGLGMAGGFAVIVMGGSAVGAGLGACCSNQKYPVDTDEYPIDSDGDL